MCQLYAIYTPAAPDVEKNKAKSGMRMVVGEGRGGLGQHIPGDKLVSVCGGACDAVKFQQAGRTSKHSCMHDLGCPPVNKGIGERGFELAGVVRVFAEGNGRRRVVVSWLQRTPPSMASTTSLQRRAWRSSKYVHSFARLAFEVF